MTGTNNGRAPSGVLPHPRRIRRQRTKGWRRPVDAVIVDRTSRWGNPFPVEVYGREHAIAMFEAYLLEHRPDLVARLPELRGRRLACWCPLDQPCHADTLARLANEQEARS